MLLPPLATPASWNALTCSGLVQGKPMVPPLACVAALPSIGLGMPKEPAFVLYQNGPVGSALPAGGARAPLRAAENFLAVSLSVVLNMTWVNMRVVLLSDSDAGVRLDAPPRHSSYCAVRPTSTTIADPVMKPASSDARNTMPSAMSSAAPRRPIGCCRAATLR